MAGFSIIAKLGLDSSKFGSGLRATKSKLGQFGSAIGTVVKAGALAAGAAITGMTAKGLADFVQFDKGMREVFTLIPQASGEMREKMLADVRSLAVAMGVDLEDAVKGLYNAISAGIPADNAVSFLEDATKLAVAGVTSLDDAVGALTTVINGYGYETTEANRVSDILFTTVKNGVTTMTELGSNIGKVTPIAAQLGVEFEEVGAMFGTLTKSLGKGKTAEAGTGIRAMLNELAKDGQKASDAFKEMAGESFPDFIEKGGTVAEALTMMSEEAKRNGKNLNDMFGGIEAGTAALILSADGARELTDQFAKMKDATGATDAAFAEMEKSLSRQIDKMKAGLKEFGLKLGEAVVPFMEDVLPIFLNTLDMIGPAFAGGQAGGDALGTTLDGLVTVVEVLAKGVLSVVNVFGMWGDLFSFVGAQAATFGKTLGDLGKLGFEPIIVTIEAAGDAFVALGQLLANPFDPKNAADAMEKVRAAGDKMAGGLKKFGDNFVQAWDKNQAGFAKNNDKFIQDMARRGKMFKGIWGQNLQAAQQAQAANQGAVNPLAAGNANAAGMARGLNNAKRGAINFGQKMVIAEKRLEDAKKVANKLKEEMALVAVQAGKIADFHRDTQTILEDLLKKEGLRHDEKREYIKMLETQKRLEQDMRDITEKGFNKLVLDKFALEEAARIAKRHIKDLPAMAAMHKDIEERIKRATERLQRGNWGIPMGGPILGNAWQDIMDKQFDVQEWEDIVAQALNDVERLKAKGAEVNPLALAGAEAHLKQVEDKIQAVKALKEEKPVMPEALIGPQAADFQIFQDMDKKLGSIDSKLGGFFVNQ